MSRAEFEKSRMAYDATVRNLELLGEAARNVPDEVRSANSQIPWKRIVGLRNILIHGYLAIDNEIIWDIVTRELPALLPHLEKLAAASESDSDT